MNDPETPPDEQIAALLTAAEKDAPPPDREFLARLREQSAAAFESANAQAAPSPAPSTPPRKRTMIPIPFRWLAASAAALVLVGIGLAYWLTLPKPPAPISAPPEEKFVVGDGLVDDGRIGKVTDAQGVVAVKPVLHERWSPVQPRLVLKPGDWLRTDARGANAVAVQLIKSAALVVGPHSTVELVKADEIRVLAGEIEIATGDIPVQLHGPDKQTLTVKGGKQHYRVEKDRLALVEKEPAWLKGFRGATAGEPLGSLVAKVDGRDVPLTVGYHHVTVDIRDQIARTTIEESFVNTTPGVLEGVFHFPLPQDASIAGFGMWINDQLVEADVVEKQRAREIYEEILQSRRDPGLLEWAGGNVFKARVFPIPGRSEKRIKITYTQVLPLQGNRVRYSYGLQSELLKQHPVRELKIDVKVNSAAALKSASSPTHPARVAKTDHSAHVEWAAQEHTPTRDFEAVFELDGPRPEVVVLPHRRGSDGYFLIQLTPPGAAANAERPIIPNGQPVRLLLVADTSASMDRAQRAAQHAVVASLLGALTPKDEVNLAACDVNCDWAFEKPVPATESNVATMLAFLNRRTSLGWTDLDNAFASALNQSAAGTHVVYLGDGTPTTGNADPVAFAQRLKKMYEEKAGTFHAVALGSTYEPGVLKAIAALGSGSLRHVSSDRGPQATALDLLGEIASPGLRDVKVEFTGVRTARVYPEVLPNVPAGTQQILLGRYLPEGKDQSGEVIVTGTLAGKPVRYASKFTLKDAEAGNSFIPRLWARMHLDALLEKGRTEAVKQEVIALSEEFNIITPYTSLLVLESDADRERYGVKRRFQMRDGEKFFADGRDNATFELKQKQMKLAADYRTALRRSILAQLNGLGRDPRLFRGPSRFPSSSAARSELAYGLGSGRGYLIDRMEWDVKELADAAPHLLNEDVGLDVWEGDEREKMKAEKDSFAERATSGRVSEEWGLDVADRRKARNLYDLDLYDETAAVAGGYFDGVAFDPYGGLAGRPEEFGLPKLHALAANPYYRGRLSGRYRGPQLQWIGPLFPAIAPPAREPKPVKSAWPAPALALSRSLLRTDALGKLKGGVIVTRQTDGFDARGELSSRGKRLELVSPTAWLARTAPDGGPINVTWCDAKEYGTYSTAFQLGRVRPSNAHDLRQLPLELGDDSLTPLHESCAGFTPTIETPAKGQSLLILKRPVSADYEIRVLIDTERHVVLSVEYRDRGKATRTTKFSDFVEAAGTWWARRVETFDGSGRRQSLTTQTVSELGADEFARRMQQELAGKDKVLFLRAPLPAVADAKAAATAGKATFDDRAALTLHFAATQQWSRPLEHLRECEKLAAGKSGMRWLGDAFLLASRRHDELRKRLLDEAAALAAATNANVRANDYFLAEYLVGQANSVLETNEALGLSDTLKKVYERQPPHLDAAKAWRVHRVSLFERAGQRDRAIQLAKELATDFPRDYRLQYNYVQIIAGAGDYAAAYAWLDRALGAGAKWEPAEAEQLRDFHARLLEQQGRHRDLADYLGAWVKRDPEGQQTYARYLSALVYSNQAEHAEELVAKWLREAQVEGEVPTPVAARFGAAREFVLGQGHNLYSNRFEEKWHEPLAAAALYFAARETHLNLASSILGTSRFTNTDAGRAVRKALAETLRKEIDTLPAARVDYLVNWVWSDAGMEGEDWKKVAASLRKRWDAEKKPAARYALARPLARILGWLGPDDVLPFLRVQWKEAPEAYRAAHANELFQALLSRPWSADVEDEAFGLLGKLADLEAANALPARVAALHRLTDAMLEARHHAKLKVIEQVEKLTRTELRKKHDEARRAAREGYADRLRKEAPRHAKPFGDWVTAERVWLDVLLERDLKSVAEDCWAILAAAPVKAQPDAEPTAEARLDEALRARALVTLQNLAARKGADAALVERLVKYIDGQLKAKPDDPRWRAEKFGLLVALDRAKELEAELCKWADGADADGRWRLALGYLLAEQGKVADAIKQFESLEADDELGPAAYRSLAEWYLVENRRAQYEKARAAAYKTADEYQLYQRVNQYLQPWRSSTGQLPTQLDPEVLNLFAALFEKSATPQSYLGQLQQFYQASRDFRLLAMLPDGVIGHTAGKAYPFLQGMQSVLGEVRDEATADEIVKRIAALRLAAKTAVDSRALDLLELLVERRAAELQNQPGPHADKALAALQRAFKREWSPGEPRLMADLLASLGAVPQAAIAKEQLRQLKELHDKAATGSLDRLHIAARRAETLNAYSQRPEAMKLLEESLKEFEDANGGVLPVTANDALARLISLTEAAGQYDRGEKALLAQLKHPAHAEQKDWLNQRLNELYHRALQDKGTVSLGSGAALYKALEKRLLAELPGADQNRRYQLFSQIARTYRTAHELQLAGVADDLRAFASKLLPPLLKEQRVNHESTVGEVASALEQVSGPRDAVAFVLDRIDDAPDWLRYTNQDAWGQHSSRLGWWRVNVKDLGDLEPRFLKFVLTELRRDLRSREPRSRYVYDRRHSYYWPEKEAEFAKVAEEVLAERKSSGATAEYVADYLFHGLAHEKRAIEVLFTAHEWKALAESGRVRLIDSLHRTQRYEESVPLLRALVAERPDNLGYRTRLMSAYFRTEKRPELQALLKETDRHFHEKDRWTEGALAALAEGCLEAQLYSQAATYYEELIPRHQRAHPRHGAGDGTLSGYYARAAQAYSGLGTTRKAVDMASAAIVSWGPNQEQRRYALDALVRVLADAKDLVAYAAELDKEPLQSAVVRKALGRAYAQRGDHAKAVPQLQLASELQPDDAEVYTALLACHDELGDKAAAVRELLRAVELSRRDIKLYEQLGSRLAQLSQPAESERAYTSIVEMLPNESEGHALLAEVREKQKRWPEAIAHWQRVAEIRALEPTGLVKLAAAQIEFKDWDSAAKTVRTLKSQSWPPRFNEVEKQTRELEKKLEGRPKK